jgi:hypothetical protein
MVTVFANIDLDSDNDGCSDSNEYYNNNTSAAMVSNLSNWRTIAQQIQMVQ